MKISIITACYNSAATIRGTMESVVLQEVEQEVEKVGGGGRRNFSFKWVSEKDRGMYDALNKGIAMATGDVIGLLNADEVLAAVYDRDAHGRRLHQLLADDIEDQPGRSARTEGLFLQGLGVRVQNQQALGMFYDIMRAEQGRR